MGRVPAQRLMYSWLACLADAGTHEPAARWVGRTQARASGLFLKIHIPCRGGQERRIASAEKRGPNELASPPVPKVL